jgi:glutamate-1-semialdehyde 2,1-aminomutase
VTTVVDRAEGARRARGGRDLDGNWSYDLGGSYGVNLFGVDFYKACIERGVERARDLGLVLGAYHPVVLDNVDRLRAISGMDEVSFHMSGTEAVMQAVRLARYHTGRAKVVRFAGAYHGWWDGVQAGVGNPRPARDVLTLAEMRDDALRALRARDDVACVLVNPVQAMHPNGAPPGDSTLVAGDRRFAFDRAAYADWLARLRAVCDARGIVLVLDEVFLGFRLALGGAQEYFGVRADLVTYGKSLGGGLPVGVLAGRRALMRRFRDDRPTDVCLARGTFNAHPYVMATMSEFLRHVNTPAVRAHYADLDAVWTARSARWNARLADRDLPVRVGSMTSVWTTVYTRPSRYHWMLQYYLRAAGLAMSWIGTGRFIFPHDLTDATMDAIGERFVSAAAAMARDGWWDDASLTDRDIKRRVARELLSAALRRASSGRLPPEQRERGAVVDLHVVERVGEDLRRPHEPGLRVARGGEPQRAPGQPRGA